MTESATGYRTLACDTHERILTLTLDRPGALNAFTVEMGIALTRQMMLRNSRADPLTAHKTESLAMFYASTGDGKEGVASFLEKRPPAYESAGDGMPPFYPWW